MDESILTTAAEIRDETVESANTHTKVGTLLVAIAQLLATTESTANNALSNSATAQTLAAAAETAASALSRYNQLLGLIRGTGSDVNALIDPFKFLGDFDTLDAAVTTLTSLDFSGQTYGGPFRFTVSGMLYEGGNQIVSYSGHAALQYIRGGVSVTDGELVQNFNAFNVAWRRLDDGVATDWAVITSNVTDAAKVVSHLSLGRTSSNMTLNVTFYDDSIFQITVPHVNGTTAGLMSAEDYSALSRLSANIVELGDFSTSYGAENAAYKTKYSGNNNIAIMRYTVSSLSKQGWFIQQVGDTRTWQMQIWDGHVYVRLITFTDSTRATVSTVTSAEQTMPTELVYDAATRKLSMNDVGDITFGAATLPEASTSAAGLLSASDKEKLDNAPTDKTQIALYGSFAFVQSASNLRLRYRSYGQDSTYTPAYVEIPAATSTYYGVMSPTDKSNLDNIADALNLDS